ncbi:MAG TPA: hypothetical protein VFA12_19775 [Stellaceae bacterium]|nr:hypothetical protein [Stellaceae bacterium]
MPPRPLLAALPLAALALGFEAYAAWAGVINPPAGTSSFNPASPGPIGGTTPSTVAATALTVGGGTGQFLLGMKNATPGTDPFPVPSFRPTTANSTLAMDLMPNGTPSDGGYGYAWNDICDTDILNAGGGQVTHCLHLYAGSGAVGVVGAGYGESANPLVLGSGQAPGFTNVEWISGGRAGFGGQPYGNGGVIDVTKNSTYTTEAAGLTIGTGNNAQPEFLAGVDNANNFAYVQSASRSTSFTAVPLAINPNGGNVRFGTGSALATSATTGFPLIPTMAGAPTGSVGAAGQAAIVIDTADNKLCWSTGGGTWKCASGT